MTCFAVLTAATVMSALVDRVQKPWLSGGLTVTRATSTFLKPRSNNRGTSLKNIGMKSARPEFTASRQFSPINTELDRKIPDNTVTLHSDFLQNSVYGDEEFFGVQYCTNAMHTCKCHTESSKTTEAT